MKRYRDGQKDRQTDSHIKLSCWCASGGGGAYNRSSWKNSAPVQLSPWLQQTELNSTQGIFNSIHSFNASVISASWLTKLKQIFIWMNERLTDWNWTHVYIWSFKLKKETTTKKVLKIHWQQLFTYFKCWFFIFILSFFIVFVVGIFWRRRLMV